MGRESLGVGCGVQEGTTMTRHIGGSLDDFLSDDDLIGDCELVTQERVLYHLASPELDSKLEEILKLIMELESSKNLDPDLERILRDNLWDLYGS